MNKIYYIMGMTCSGKTTLAKEIIKISGRLNITRVPEYTNRPIRSGEKEGKDYFFVTDKEFECMKDNDDFIEYREYNVANGDVYKYGLGKDKVLDALKDNNVLITGAGIVPYFNIKNSLKDVEIYPVFLWANTDTILERYLNRIKQGESDQDTINKECKELCRRVLADSDSMSKEIATKSGIPEGNVYCTEKVSITVIINDIINDILSGFVQNRR